jgi:sialic acid synthase SpsE
LLETIDVDRYKIASADIVNKPLLRAVAATEKPIVLSTGMSSIAEVERAVEFLHDQDSGPVVLLHCVSCYPAEPSDLNLQFMNTLQQAVGLPVGFSDHTLGTAMPIVAAGLGATMIEKHFTLDRNMEGPDHAASLEPDELSTLVEDVRDTQVAVGDGTTGRAACEIKNRPSMRRSLHTRHEMAAGDELTEEDILVVRPAAGIDPWEIDDVVGRILTADLDAHEPLDWKDLE